MENNLSKLGIAWLLVLRIFIGWHFLYEGIVKLLNPDWTASAYLMDSQGMFRSLFVNMAGNTGLMNTVNLLNEWSLLIIGLCLIIGCFTRLSCIGGILLLLLYSLSHPALLGMKYLMPFEGSYFIIDKNLVELAALGVLFAIPTGRVIGIDRYLSRVLPSGFQKFII